MLLEYYTLDECTNREKIFEKLDDLVDDSKITYKVLEYADVIKIKDISLTLSETKKILKLFDTYNILEYIGMEELQEIDFEDDGFEDDDLYDDYEY